MTRSSSALLVTVLLTGCATARPSHHPSLSSNPVEHLRTAISAATNREGVRRGTWGIVVESLASGERIVEHNASALMVPASTMKLVSLATAAEAVGWDYRFETRLLATGPVVGGTLHGDLVIAGTGDPSTLGRPDPGDFGPWVAAVRAFGIERVAGRVIGDDNAADEAAPGFAWSWDDLGFGYGSMPGMLNLRENTVRVTIAPGPAAGAPARVTLPPDAEDLPLGNAVTTGAADARRVVWPELAPGADRVTIRGTVPAGTTEAAFTIAAINPTAYFAQVFRRALVAAGVDVAGSAVDVDDLPAPTRLDGSVVHVHVSPPLADIAVPLMKESINLYAEAMVRLNTGRAGLRTSEAAFGAARARLASWGIPEDGVQMRDGSGLSRRDVIAADALVAILRRFYDPSGASPWMRALPVAGVDGTLDSRMKGTRAEGVVRAKTGSLSNVRSLAGYATTADGEPVAFAILVNNFEGPGRAANDAIDAIAGAIASFSRATAAKPGDRRLVR